VARLGERWKDLVRMKLRRQAKLLFWKYMTQVWNGLKGGLRELVVEYWPQLLLTLSAIYCFVSLMRLMKE
jgi:hypothetical protein